MLIPHIECIIIIILHNHYNKINVGDFYKFSTHTSQIDKNLKKIRNKSISKLPRCYYLCQSSHIVVVRSKQKYNQHTDVMTLQELTNIGTSIFHFRGS